MFIRDNSRAIDSTANCIRPIGPLETAAVVVSACVYFPVLAVPVGAVAAGAAIAAARKHLSPEPTPLSVNGRTTGVRL